MKFFQPFLLVLLLTVSAPTFAVEDTPENREAQIQRYLTAAPPRDLLTDVIDSVSKTLPPQHRSEFRLMMTDYVDFDVLIDAMVGSLRRHFTAAEISAMADLYESPHGQSAMKKMGLYMADLMPVIQSEVSRAVHEFYEENDGRALGSPPSEH